MDEVSALGVWAQNYIALLSRDYALVYILQCMFINHGVHAHRTVISSKPTHLEMHLPKILGLLL